MKCSVILIAWNAMRFIPRCLESLTEATKRVDCEIIFIDNGSTDETSEYVQQHYPHIHFQHLNSNRGISVARNIGIRQAKGEYIWLLDIDTEVNGKAFLQMVDYMDHHTDVGICTIKLLSMTGAAQQSCLKMPTLPHKVKNVFFAILSKLYVKIHWEIVRNSASEIWGSNRKYFYLEQMAQADPFTCEYVIGACQMIRRDLFSKIGLLDENIFYGPEDADFCLRCWQARFQVVYLPSESIIHHYQKITNKRLFSLISWKHICGLFYFFWKHKRLFRTGI